MAAKPKSGSKRGRAKAGKKQVLTPHPGPLPVEGRGSEWVGSRDKLAAILGCHPNSFPRWVREFRDDPLVAKLKRANGDYHVPTWLEFIAKHNLSVGRGALAAGGSRLAALELAIKEEVLRQRKRENDEADGRFLLKDDVVAWVTQLASRQRGRLERLARELPPRLTGLDQTQMTARLGELIGEVIREFSGTVGPDAKGTASPLTPALSPLRGEGEEGAP